MMAQTISNTEFQFPDQRALYHGKVRDVYSMGEELLVMVATDRISAFDVILPRPIPFKGQVLNGIASYFLERTRDIIPNWCVAVPDPNVMAGHRCEPLKVEMVIRGYLTGHAWRTYKSGLRELCGVPLPEGLREHDRLPAPIITPSTKASEGHDEDISREEILKQGIVAPDVYEKMETATYRLYNRGVEMAAARGLILVDTKYEFGIHQGQLLLMDEIHTPDSSRYFCAEGYAERQARGEQQRQLSKEFVREWLIAGGFMGKEGQTVPEMTDEFVEHVSARYIELFEQLRGQPFQGDDDPDPLKRIDRNVKSWLKERAY
jgi:phosphoribosylaminoimidazole-succinocarboxamide synthase